MNNQKGFTLIELLAVLFFICGIGFAGFLIWVACHFLAKFW